MGVVYECGIAGFSLYVCYLQFGKHRYILLICASVRLLFVPLFLLCNFDKGAVPVVFSNDVWPVIFVLFFGLTNGYVGSMLMMSAPM